MFSTLNQFQFLLTFSEIYLSVYFPTTAQPVISLLYSQEVLEVKSTYQFTYPRVTVQPICCNCKVDQNLECQSTILSANEVCIAYEDKNSHGYIKMHAKSEPNTRSMRAYKLNRQEHSAFNVFEYKNRDAIKKIEVPVAFKQFLVEDDIAYQVVKQPFTNVLGEYEWYYAEEGSNNLRTGVQMNEENEFDLKKLGWFRPQSFKLDLHDTYNVSYYDCSLPPSLNGHLDAVHFYDDAGLLRNEVHGTLLEDLSENILSIIIDKYDNIKAKFSVQSKIAKDIALVSREKIFLFTAFITFTKYGDNILSLEIKENYTGRLYIEIGFPSAQGILLTKIIFHKGKPEIYNLRLSSLLKREQWICLHPFNDINRKTCRLATYNDETIVMNENLSDNVERNLIKMPKTEFIQLSTLSYNTTMNKEAKTIAICVPISVVVFFLFALLINHKKRIRNSFCGKNYSIIVIERFK